MECKVCLNSDANPSIRISDNGLCSICEIYRTNFNRSSLEEEKEFFESFIGNGKKYDIMAGISGGKDSSAMLYTLKKMGFKPLAFTFDIGYYPMHEFSRARAVAKTLGVDYEVIDIRKYLNRNDVNAYRRTAELYSKRCSHELSEEFRRIYLDERRYYSIKSSSSLPVVRTCQLCRRAVIRGYYSEAKKRKIPLVALAINEWAGLSQDYHDKRGYVFSSMRRLKPSIKEGPVHVVHVPFMLRRKLSETRQILKKIGWNLPQGEELIESNSNSCLFARAAETKATRLLGFHPDTPRISREITVGFITKEQGRGALNKIHRSKYSVGSVLSMAKII
ncbi:MAG: hypothetical protein BJBARM5_0389 [Candidatus Parvarchaeum acidophilus ARMAN-5]|uniref:PP-loop domain protein n=1 Tax=Candidatus Parvarchaeum acidophilus ARMAN-5 TaxID=662762 RepID=D6GV81_PARA5|nr:MAG: hypothetical protein BJBARM5_0389 [Candidatus Parvarchaeum acidophilus ARMAN-5]